MMRTTRRLALLAMVMTCALAALSAQAATQDENSANANARTITLIGQNDLRFSKSHLTVAPGKRVTIKLVNKSHLPASAMSHNWVLLKQGVNVDAFDRAAESASGAGYFPKAKANEVIAHTAMVAGGHSASVTFTTPEKPGNYTYLCTFPGHFRAGMKGTLTVKRP